MKVAERRMSTIDQASGKVSQPKTDVLATEPRRQSCRSMSVELLTLHCAHVVRE